MKRLNDNQKKWALTACLSMVLSFNLVVGLTSGTKYDSATFASTSNDDGEWMDEEQYEETSDEVEKRFENIVTEDGRLKVKYIQGANGKTKAIVPKKVEGGYCWEDCGKTYLLPKDFDSNKLDLEIALRKAMKKASQKSFSEDEDLDEKPVAKRLKRPLREEDDIEFEEDQELAALQKKCDSKDDDSRIECFSRGMTRILKNKKKDHEKDQVLALYKKEVEPGLVDMMTDTRDSDRRENGQELLEEMLSSIAKKHNYLRQRMVRLASLVVIRAQQSAQKSFRQAEQLKTTNPGRALQLSTDGFNKRSMAENMAFNLDATLQSGLESANLNKLISESQMVDLYTVDFVDVVNPAIEAMRQNPYNAVLQTSTLTDSAVMDSNGNLILLDSSSGPIGQLRANGRGIQIMSNGLTPGNAANAGTPRIAVINGANMAGTATITVIPANQVPQMNSMNNGQGIPRIRGQ